MPLLDHFHPPVSEQRSWEGFQGLWAAAIVEKLNSDVLAEEYFADMHVHIGSQVEIDVAALQEKPGPGERRSAREPGATAMWAPPTASMVMPALFPDDIEVQVFTTTTGASLVAVIELVSPGNKDRLEARRAFAAKCVSYLSRGIGLVVVDVVTNRLANLHNEMAAWLGCGAPFLMEPASSTYCAAYRPSQQREGGQIEIWPVPVHPGDRLPVLPLALRNAGSAPLDLESTYMVACRRSRLHQTASGLVDSERQGTSSTTANSSNSEGGVRV